MFTLPHPLPPLLFAIGIKFNPGYTRLNLGFPERNDILNYLPILFGNVGGLTDLYKKNETERHIAVKNGSLNDFKRKWGLFKR